ncbi:tumor necrosis factor alpha-induced protein 3 [Biomphalaria glabrata]|uniref:ubiquitinyl hydrolase 1 n=1 Tax=Biomphalaria glabrata TaxID=6526 RepID=A0A2C9K222_BIOGL|nr:tumor necrosis factor alpha-induced protein 3 [Biomphalaria glabrata]
MELKPFTDIDKFKREIQQSLSQNIDYRTDHKPITFKHDISFYDCQLPNTSKITRKLKKSFSQLVIDEAMTEDLENIQAINWTKTEFLLQAISVPRDGNCLLHSISLYIWSITDDANILRELLHIAIVNDIECRFKKRWSRQHVDELSLLVKSTDQLIDKEWEDIANHVTNVLSKNLSAAVPHHSLEAVHIYILANILRRPIIIITSSFACSYSGQQLQSNNLSGLYLPLEWQPQECCKTPVLLGYHLNHFAPLLSEASTENIKDLLFPLVDKDLCFLPIRFLLKEEDCKAWDLIQGYLAIKELEVNIAGSNVAKIPWVQIKVNPPAVNIFEKIFNMCEQEHDSITARSKLSAGANTPAAARNAVPSAALMVASAPLMSGLENHQALSMLNVRCKNNCGYRCSVGTFPFCHQCFENEQEKMHQVATAPSLDISISGEGTSSQSNSFEVISCPLEDKNSPYTEITWQEGENIYILKTPDTNESTPLCVDPKPINALERLVSKVLIVNPTKDQGNFSKQSLLTGSNVRDLQREKEKTFQKERNPEHQYINKISPQSSPAFKSQYSRGKPCIMKGCPNFGDPAEQNMCSSCYRNQLCMRENDKLLQTAMRETAPQISVKSLNNTSFLHGSGSSLSYPSKLHMQESTSAFSETAPSSLYSHFPSSFYNEAEQTHANELVTSVSSMRPRLVYSDPHQEKIETFERTLRPMRTEPKCQRSECSNYGNASKQGYCNACFDRFKKEILAASYGDDVPD